MQDFMINVTGATRGRTPLGGIPQVGSYVRLHEKRWRVLEVEVDLDAARGAVQNHGMSVPVLVVVEAA